MFTSPGTGILVLPKNVHNRTTRWVWAFFETVYPYIMTCVRVLGRAMFCGDGPSSGEHNSGTISGRGDLRKRSAKKSWDPGDLGGPRKVGRHPREMTPRRMTRRALHEVTKKSAQVGAPAPRCEREARRRQQPVPRPPSSTTSTPPARHHAVERGDGGHPRALVETRAPFFGPRPQKGSAVDRATSLAGAGGLTPRRAGGVTRRH
jgi:hypothetical protein